MNAKVAVLTVLGPIVTILGTLWLVQGLGILQIGPVLCVADCEPITGRSMQWTVIGVIALIAGIAISGAGLRRINR